MEKHLHMQAASAKLFHWNYNKGRPEHHECECREKDHSHLCNILRYADLHILCKFEACGSACILAWCSKLHCDQMLRTRHPRERTRVRAQKRQASDRMGLKSSLRTKVHNDQAQSCKRLCIQKWCWIGFEDPRWDLGTGPLCYHPSRKPVYYPIYYPIYYLKKTFRNTQNEKDDDKFSTHGGEWRGTPAAHQAEQETAQQKS
jgi:hypothetical protein